MLVGLVRLPVFWAAVALALAAFARLVAWASPGFRMLFVPRTSALPARPRQRAETVSGAQRPPRRERTGVLIFVSLAERYAEVVADTGIDAERPDRRKPGTAGRRDSDRARGDRLADGFVCGRRHRRRAAVDGIFRSAPDDANELDDHLAEIRQRFPRLPSRYTF